MAFKFSKELRRQQCVTGSLKSILDGSVIRIYGGVPPVSVDDPVTNNELLCEISVDSSGQGVTFESSASDAVLVKSLDEVWSGNNIETGTATFFRFVKPTDSGLGNNQEVRIQGTVGGPADDLTISNSSLIKGAPQRLEYFAIALLEY